MQNIKRWISLVLVVCLLAMLPAAALAEDTETGAGLPVEGEIVTSPSPSASAAVESETVTFPSPSASAAAESETATSPSPSASAAAESETVTSPSPSIEASISPSPSAETSSAPTDAAEVKTIASFEAVAPEGLSVPQGTPETGLGLPASLSVQFADGAAGYDPSAEAGGQFAFAAVLPEGYALAEAASPVTEDAEANLLLVPLEEMVESSLSPANWIEATEIEPARFEALLTDSGLFAMVGEQ